MTGTLFDEDGMKEFLDGLDRINSACDAINAILLDRRTKKIQVLDTSQPYEVKVTVL